MRVVALGLCTLIVLALPNSAQAGNCNPDSGFEWCYEYPNQWSSTPKIQVDIDYNTTSLKGYKVSQGSYVMRFKCSGTLYYGATSCWHGGCNGQNLGGGVSTKTIASAYSAKPKMAEIRCYTQSGSGWAWGGYNPWTSNVYVVHCYNDGHCAACNTCTSSGAPSNWKCKLDSESCNGKDDDCDGSTDENWADLGQSCSAGVGECSQSGIKICNGQGNGTKCSVSGGQASAEKCDAKDNDCDGSTDEDFGLGDACNVGVGECLNSGAKICKPDQTGSECNVSPLPVQDEVCDGKDNDCDGVADNGFDLGAGCSVGIGECTNSGVTVCKADKTGTKCNASPLAPSAELCDAKDNDCDGATDEDFDVSDDCAVGVGECLNTGNKICTNDGSGTQCSVAPLPPQDELCDAKDNDCDSATDEDFELGKPCQVGVGGCEALGLTVCIADGFGTKCDATPLPPQDELCDAEDNDCDGATDEDFDLLELCTVGVGECLNTGIKQCTVDELGTECSVSPLQSGAELCDGLDNDCDGQADNGFPLGDPCTVGVGSCTQTGQLICLEDGLGTECSATPLPPGPELCDGLDNDCDGAGDEDFDVGEVCAVGIGECVAAGVKVCRADGFGTECDVEPLPPGPELCDGLDNDCDGEADNGFPLADPCSVGIGECIAQGQLVCNDDGTGTKCDAEPLPPGFDLCDGLDNDCDVQIDEDYDLGVWCSVGIGECLVEGIKVCAEDGADTVCSGVALLPSAELCDGLDNDCDGEMDNGFPVADPCTVGIGECTNLGVNVCADNQVSVLCSVVPLPPADESCDGLDNDCDGLEDNGFAVGDACFVGTGECETEGVQVCNGSKDDIVCDAFPGEPETDVCDGLDNDCDGGADEDYPVGDSCTVGIGVCFADGKLVCTGDAVGTKCSASPGKGYNEWCDGLDNDCDGAIDEDFPLDEPCVVGVGECVAEGLLGCNEAEDDVACQAAPLLPEAELCDGLDNDCDGIPDENFPGLAGLCHVGIGSCLADGERVCSKDGGSLECDAQPFEPEPEECNLVDDDCDGTVDEECSCAAGDKRPCGPALGECLPGVQLCDESGTWGDCVGAAEPLPEVCDGLDNDCDGIVDPACGCLAGDSQPCGPDEGECEPGTKTCLGGNWGPCDGVIWPEQELCDDLDNDCDGLSDEPFPGLGLPCEEGIGECHSEGLTSCMADGLSLFCTATAGEPEEETCNGLDDDCDGEIDEPPACFECTPGEAESCTASASDCELGTRVCLDDGIWGECLPSSACGDLDYPEVTTQTDVIAESDYEVIEAVDAGTDDPRHHPPDIGGEGSGFYGDTSPEDGVAADADDKHVSSGGCATSSGKQGTAAICFLLLFALLLAIRNAKTGRRLFGD